MRVSFVLVLFVILAPFALATFSASLEEGASDTYTIGARQYNVLVLIINDYQHTVKFRINGQLTPNMIAHETFVLADGATLEPIEINTPHCGDVTCDTVLFTIRNCGDATCDANEACGSCPSDCGCTQYQYCQDNACHPVQCGDDICSEGETCNEDSCCDGEETDLHTRYDCGRCGNRCDLETELCKNQACTGFCGNTICDEGEEESCIKDCGYCGDTICEQEEQRFCKADCGFCGDSICQKYEKKNCADCAPKMPAPLPPKPKDQCTRAADCTDNNPCTKDLCSGTPKACTFDKQQGCIAGQQCIESGKTANVNGVPSYCKTTQWLAKKEESTQCLENYECLSNNCKNKKCYVYRTFTQKIAKWLNGYLRR